MVRRSPLPITVKTRLGWDEDSRHIVYLAEALQDIGVQAIAIHGRTRVQMYKGQADWTLIGAVKNNPRMHIPIFGNGDVDSPEKALANRNRYGVDGIMIGRAAIGYPWIFREIKHFFQTGVYLDPPDTAERVRTCLVHFERSLQWKGEKLGILEMRRHYAPYFKGYPDFKEYRMRLVQCPDPHEIRAILNEIDQQYAGFRLQAGNPAEQAIEN
jgi:nifR3 family TIM-barrel protein